MKKQRSFWVIFVFLISTWVTPAQSQTSLQKAEAALKEGNPDAALTHYEQMLQNGLGGALLHYNIGSLVFQKGDLGRAIFHLEKARQLSPFDDNINANLEIARDARVDADVGARQQSSWWELVVRSLPWDNSIRVWMGILLLGWLLLILRLALPQGVTRIPLKWVVICGGLGLVLTSILAYRVVLDDKTFAALIPTDCEGKSAPASGAETSFTAQAGAYGEILEAQNGFLRLRLHNGLEAWFQENQLYVGASPSSSGAEP